MQYDSHFPQGEEAEDSDSVTDIYETITDEEWDTLAKWDRAGKFI